MPKYKVIFSLLEVLFCFPLLQVRLLEVNKKNNVVCLFYYGIRIYLFIMAYFIKFQHAISIFLCHSMYFCYPYCTLSIILIFKRVISTLAIFTVLRTKLLKDLCTDILGGITEYPYISLYFRPAQGFLFQ